MAAETGFLIDGKLHPYPTRDTFDLDEWQLMWEYARVTLEDYLFMDDDEEPEAVQIARAEKFRNPAVWAALMHIAYKRENPTLPDAKIKALIGKTNLLEQVSNLFGEDEEADAVPLALTTPPDETSPPGTETSGKSSAPTTTTSTNGSDEPGDPPVATGRLRSATSSTPRETSSAA